MAISWKFEEVEIKDYEIVPDGEYDVRITYVDDSKTTSNGDPMAVITLAVVGHNCTINHRIVFFSDADKREITNRNLTGIYRGFPNIIKGSMPSKVWVGKVGRAQIGHHEYDGKVYNDVKKFLVGEKKPVAGLDVSQDDLPF